MSTPHSAKRVLGLVIITMVLIAVSGCSEAAPDAQCDCRDVELIKARIYLVEQAIEKYPEQLAELNMAQLEWNETRARDLNARIDSVLEAQAFTGFAGTNNVFCTVTIEAATPCMRESIRRHEALHVAACENGPGLFRRGLGESRWKTMEDFADEEVDGYKTELKFLQELLQTMEPCNGPVSARPPERYPTTEERQNQRERIDRAAERIQMYADTINPNRTRTGTGGVS